MSGTGRRTDGLVSAGLTVSKLLIALNVIVFAVMTVRGDPQNTEYMLQHGAFWAPAVMQQQEYYRLITPIFLHFSLSHLFNNMLLLFFMGDVLEGEIGHIRFALLYLLSGIAGNLMTLAVELHTGDYAVSAGASGAVTGVLGALLALLLMNHGKLSYLSVGSMAFFVLYTIFSGLSSSGVNNAAHIGGLIAGFVLIYVLWMPFRHTHAG